MHELLPGLGEQTIVAFALTLARIVPLFVLAPLLSSKLIPMQARSVIAVALAIGLTPAAQTTAGAIPVDAFSLIGLIVKELLVGLAYAFALGALFAAIAAAGSLLDTLIGFSFGALVDPVTGNQATILNQLYSMVAVLVFIAIGGDGLMIQGLARTYDLVPLVDAPHVNALVAGVQSAFVTILTSALEVCAPVMIAIVLTDIAFGLVAKVVPQLNVFAVGFPAKVAVGLLLIGASLPFMAGWLNDSLQQTVGDALRAVGG